MRLKTLVISPKDKAVNIKNKEQVNRSKWRGLLLCIKAKIESVESGIETFEEAFMPHILLKDGQTIGDKLLSSMEKIEHTSPTILLGFN